MGVVALVASGRAGRRSSSFLPFSKGIATAVSNKTHDPSASAASFTPTFLLRTRRGGRRRKKARRGGGAARCVRSFGLVKASRSFFSFSFSCGGGGGGGAAFLRFSTFFIRRWLVQTRHYGVLLSHRLPSQVGREGWRGGGGGGREAAGDLSQTTSSSSSSSTARGRRFLLLLFLFIHRVKARAAAILVVLAVNEGVGLVHRRTVVLHLLQLLQERRQPFVLGRQRASHSTTTTPLFSTISWGWVPWTRNGKR